MNKNEILLSTIILLIAVFVIGCTVQPNNRAQTRLGVDREDLGMRRNNMNVSRKAEQIAEKIERLNNINEAYVLISGNTAIVGVDMDRNVQGQITNDLKARIEKIVKDTANNIKNVSVTADPDLLTRIEKMAEDIANGRPITGFAEQFQEILRRIAPTR